MRPRPTHHRVTRGAGCGLALRSCVAIAGLSFAGTAGAAVLHVPGDFPTIQSCINAAITGDECVVAPGTYNELINFHGKAITLRSSDGPAVTIIDAGPVPEPPEGKPVVRCDTNEGPDTVLDGFTITGGTGGVCQDPVVCGGGMYNAGASPTVTNCTFTDNSADGGGGMANSHFSSPSVTNCTFNNSGSGGGMLNYIGSSPMVTTCTFSGNSGGGMWNLVSSNPTVTDCTFRGNSGGGGGMVNSNASNPTVTNCTFIGNTASRGGGMHNTDNSNPTVANCTFSGNVALDTGGAMYNQIASSPAVTNCTFSGNSAGALGGGIFSTGEDGTPTLDNCVLWGNAPDQIVDGFGAVTTVGYSDVQSGWAGAGNIDADPLFADSSGPMASPERRTTTCASSRARRALTRPTTPPCLPTCPTLTATAVHSSPYPSTSTAIPDSSMIRKPLIQGSARRRLWIWAPTNFRKVAEMVLSKPTRNATTVTSTSTIPVLGTVCSTFAATDSITSGSRNAMTLVSPLHATRIALCLFAAME